MPNPATNKALHPAIPITVMKKRFLYLNILRAVTFLKKERWFHINGIRSKIIFLPILAAFGRINWLGTSINSL